MGQKNKIYHLPFVKYMWRNHWCVVIYILSKTRQSILSFIYTIFQTRFSWAKKQPDCANWLKFSIKRWNLKFIQTIFHGGSNLLKIYFGSYFKEFWIQRIQFIFSIASVTFYLLNKNLNEISRGQLFQPRMITGKGSFPSE